jgi:hypothetical protein
MTVVSILPAYQNLQPQPPTAPDSPTADSSTGIASNAIEMLAPPEKQVLYHNEGYRGQVIGYRGLLSSSCVDPIFNHGDGRRRVFACGA